MVRLPSGRGRAWGPAPLRGITPPVTVDTHVPSGGLGDPGTTRGLPRVREPRERPRVRHWVAINLGPGNGSIGPQGCPRSRYR